MSDDGTRSIIGDLSKEHPVITPVYGDNKGQLETILTGLKAINSDLVFLLDADDRYSPNHVEMRVGSFLAHGHPDIMYGRHSIFGDPVLRSRLLEKQDHENARWLGDIDLEAPYDWAWSAALAWSLPSYHVGGVTSTLSLRHSHFSSLPLAELCAEFKGALKANADYILLLASALFLGRKVYTPERTVEYRIHANSPTGSCALGNPQSDYFQRYNCATARNWLCSARRFGSNLTNILDKELKAVPIPSIGHRRLYRNAKLRSFLHQLTFV